MSMFNTSKLTKLTREVYKENRHWLGRIVLIQHQYFRNQVSIKCQSNQGKELYFEV